MKQSISLVIILATFLAVPFPIEAAKNYDLKEMTPPVQQALGARQARFSELQRLKALGTIGEDNQGFVRVLKPSPQAEETAGKENVDRKTIYQAIVDQNHLGPGGLIEVKRAFAEVQREKAKPGEFVQEPSGNWIQA